MENKNEGSDDGNKLIGSNFKDYSTYRVSNWESFAETTAAMPQQSALLVSINIPLNARDENAPANIIAFTLSIFKFSAVPFPPMLDKAASGWIDCPCENVRDIAEPYINLPLLLGFVKIMRFLNKLLSALIFVEVIFLQYM